MDDKIKAPAPEPRTGTPAKLRLDSERSSLWPPPHCLQPPPGFAQRIPVRFRAKRTAVLAQGEESGQIVVLTRPDATVAGIAELKRSFSDRCGRAPSDAERSPPSSPAPYNATGPASRKTLGRLLSRRHLTRLLQDLPPADILLDSGSQAP